IFGFESGSSSAGGDAEATEDEVADGAAEGAVVTFGGVGLDIVSATALALPLVDALACELHPTREETASADRAAQRLGTMKIRWVLRMSSGRIGQVGGRRETTLRVPDGV